MQSLIEIYSKQILLIEMFVNFKLNNLTIFKLRDGF